MFVLPSRLKTQGAVVSAITAGLALAGCEDPTSRTSLRPEGPPEVLAVLVMNDPNGLIETATYCKVGDEKRPSLVGLPDFSAVQICDTDLNNGAGVRFEAVPDDPGTPDEDESSPEMFVAGGVEDAAPTFWYARIMFDELLDPNVEELVSIDDADGNPTGQFAGTLANTQPVTLMCGGMPIEYDGYYSPSGNNVTWPLGPSLFIQPVDFSSVPAGAECSITLKPDVVVDKQGEKAVDTTPFTFSLLPFEFVGSTPGDGDEITADAPVELEFNGFIDAATLMASEITIEEHTPVADPCDVTTPPANCMATCSETMACPTGFFCDEEAGTCNGAPPICADTTPTARTLAGAEAADNFLLLNGITGAPMDLLWNPDVDYLITFSANAEVADAQGSTTTSLADYSFCFSTTEP